MCECGHNKVRHAYNGAEYTDACFECGCTSFVYEEEYQSKRYIVVTTGTLKETVRNDKDVYMMGGFRNILTLSEATIVAEKLAAAHSPTKFYVAELKTISSIQPIKPPVVTVNFGGKP